MKNKKPLVGVITGSESDAETMRAAGETLARLRIPHEERVLSAHRTPDSTASYAKEARGRGLRVIIAGAGGAAHLRGMVAAHTVLPVPGVPVQSRAPKGLDSLLSIVQMPAGVPVGTLAIGVAGATNAALLAASILLLENEANRGQTRPPARWPASGALRGAPRRESPRDRAEPHPREKVPPGRRLPGRTMGGSDIRRGAGRRRALALSGHAQDGAIGS